MKLKVLAITILMLCGSCMPTSEQVINFTEEVSRVQSDIAVVNEAVKAKADQSFVDAFIEGWEASAPINPYYGYGALVIAGIKIFLDGKAKKKLSAKYQADKEGRELALREIAAMEKSEITAPVVDVTMFRAIGEARLRNKVV